MGTLSAGELLDDPLPISSAATALLHNLAETAKTADPHRLTSCGWLRAELSHRAPQEAERHHLAPERFVILGIAARARDAIALALDVPRLIHHHLTDCQFDMLTEAWEQHRLAAVCIQAAAILESQVADCLVNTDR